MREPIHEPLRELAIHGFQVTKDVSDRATKARCYGGRGDPAHFSNGRVIVYQLVLRSGKLENLGENGINRQILGFPCRSAGSDVLELVERRGALYKSIWSPITVHVDKKFGGCVSIEVENVDGVCKSIA